MLHVLLIYFIGLKTNVAQIDFCLVLDFFYFT